MSVHAKLEPANRRFSPRRRLRLGSVSTSLNREVLIHDISPTGLLLETSAKLRAFDRLDVELPEAGSRQAVVVWTSGRYFGCQFAQPLSKAAVSAALLLSPIAGTAAPRLATTTDATVQAEADTEVEEVGGRELSFGMKLRIVLGMSLVLWALILWGLGLV